MMIRINPFSEKGNSCTTEKTMLSEVIFGQVKK